MDLIIQTELYKRKLYTNYCSLPKSSNNLTTFYVQNRSM